MYDSKLRRGELSSALTHQLCLVYRTLIQVEIDSIVKFSYTQKQRGGSDCGVLAIVLALHTAMRQNISLLEFDQL